jgi:hypothetical protein
MDGPQQSRKYYHLTLSWFLLVVEFFNVMYPLKTVKKRLRLILVCSNF